MPGESIFAIISVLAAIGGVILGWIGRARESRHAIRQDAAADAGLRVDVDYIKRGIDDIKLEQRSQGQRIDCIAERVAKVEESAKSAHKRIDEMAGRTPAGKE